MNISADSCIQVGYNCANTRVISYFMRPFVLLISFIFSTSVWGQSEVDRIMEKATCDCIAKLLYTEKKDDNAFTNCFIKSTGKDTILLKIECQKIYGDTTASAFYKFGTDFFNRNSVNLIYTCDTYFSILDSTRYIQINSLNKDSIRSSIASLNMTNPKTWDKDFLVKRGLFYFALADYVNAQKDFDSSLTLDPNILQSIYFKAWIFEIKKDYDNAIKLYSDLAILTKVNDFNVFAAIAKRKKNSL
jgi:tetratricopeptide (TPR) repeat protein